MSSKPVKPVKRKRPESDEPVVVAERAERQVRLRLPIRVRAELEADHGDEAPVKAIVREVQDDSEREKNASRRDKRTETYAGRRDRILAQWAARHERRTAAELDEEPDAPRRRPIIEGRKAREGERGALLNGDYPQMTSFAAVEKGKRSGGSPRKPLMAQAEDGELPERFQRIIDKGDRPGPQNGATPPRGNRR